MAGVVGCLLLAGMGLGCGDVYRPVAQPIIGNSPPPAAVHFMYSVAANPADVLTPSGVCATSGNPPPCPQDRGMMSRIDVSGDSVLSSLATGLSPVHGALTSDGSRLYVANSGEDTISVTPNVFSTQLTTIDLERLCDSSGCAPATPVFVHTRELGKMYVADSGNGTVSIINTTSNVVVQTVAVNPAFAPVAPATLPSPDRNARPVALAEMPNAQKIYSINQGNSTVTAINTIDGTIAKVIPMSAAPIYAVPSADSNFIYVLDTNGTVAVIDTLTDSVASFAAAGAGANYVAYDKSSSRVFVTNGTAGTLSIFDVSGNTLVPHGSGTVQIPAAASACTSPAIPTSVAVLADGTKAYVASYQTGAGGLICTQASVVDPSVSTATGLPIKTITLTQSGNGSLDGCAAARFRVFAAASNGGTNSEFKVYISQCDAGATAVIATFPLSIGPSPHDADVLIANVPSPVSSLPPVQVSISAASPGSGGTATYTYSLVSGAGLQAGATIVITGMSDPLYNGDYLISSVPNANTFTVVNSAAANPATSQTGSGSAVALENPVFLITGP
jgi:YVTN family beta-propeller protein